MDPPLAERQVDKHFDFFVARNEYKRELPYYLTFLDIVKKTSPYQKFNHMANLKILNPDQKACMSILQKAIRKTASNSHTLTVITGEGGVGKSVMLSALCTQLDNNKIKYATVASWGSACVHFNSFTLFSLLGLYNFHMKADDMIKVPAHKFTRERIKAMQCIVLDECYLLSSKELAMLIHRIMYLKGISDESTLPLSLYLFGSSSQCAPINGYSLDTPPTDSMDSLSRYGLKIFQSAEFKYELTTNVRQQSDPAFQHLLRRIIKQETTDNDIIMLESRRDTNLTEKERESFQHELRLFGSNNQCYNYAYAYLYNSSHQIRRIDPKFSVNCTTCQLEYKPLYIGVNVRVCLTRNKVISRGLVNSSVGTCKNIYYSEDDHEFPKFITVLFDKYTGVSLQDKSVPVPVQKDSFFCRHLGRMVTVSYFPLSVAASKTIHKSQSHSYQRVVINFDKLHYYDRRIYVALSRCVKLSNLMITSEMPLRTFFRRK